MFILLFHYAYFTFIKNSGIIFLEPQIQKVDNTH